MESAPGCIGESEVQGHAETGCAAGGRHQAQAQGVEVVLVGHVVDVEIDAVAIVAVTTVAPDENPVCPITVQQHYSMASKQPQKAAEKRENGGAYAKSCKHHGGQSISDIRLTAKRDQRVTMRALFYLIFIV